MSSFHLLPDIILRTIIRYALGIPVEGKKSSKHAFLPLLHICSSWRCTTLSIIYAECNITLSEEVSISYRAELGGNLTTLTHLDYTRHTKCVVFNMDFKYIENGQALKHLSKIKLTSECFSSVNLVTLAFTLFDDNAEYKPRLTQTVWNTFQLMSKFLPSTYTIVLHIHEDAKHLSVGYRGTLMEVFKQGFNLTFNNTLNSQPLCIVPVLLNNITNISVFWNEQYKSTIDIIHANASRLFILSIYLETSKGLDRLFFDKNSQLVVYPYLTSLNLHSAKDMPMEHLPPYPDIAPFPRLRSLYMDIIYPFSDDVLFRNSSSTFKKLVIKTNKSSMMMLHKIGVFTQKRLAKLEILCIHDMIIEIDDADKVVDLYFNVFKHSFGSVIQLSILDSDIVEALPTFLIQNKININIRFLNISRVFLPLTDLMTILQQIPTLQKINSSATGIGIASAENIFELASIIQYNYSLQKSHFQIWEVVNKGNLPYSSLYRTRCRQIGEIDTQV
ncbi:hypothetical protein BX667DRAFT_535505 [Coemansia mojavensis]|nr:hypothetical protein BX667DRAFT_535505 [Coemansia mojavensis]